MMTMIDYDWASSISSPIMSIIRESQFKTIMPFRMITILFLACIPLVSSAQLLNQNGLSETLLDQTTSSAGLKTGTVGEFGALAGSISNVFLSILGVVFLGLMVYGGYLWMNARGNDDQVSQGKKILVSAIIGLFLIYVSSFIVNAVFEIGG